MGDGIPFEIDSQTHAIYWLENGWIRRKPLEDGSAETLLENLETPTRLTLDENSREIYWIEQCTGTIRTAALDGSSPQTLFTGLKSPKYTAMTFATTRTLGTDRPDNLPRGDSPAEKLSESVQPVDDPSV